VRTGDVAWAAGKWRSPFGRKTDLDKYFVESYAIYFIEPQAYSDVSHRGLEAATKSGAGL
jgi:hypothetical protein